jgi:heme-degrading monooxygenase HmoA
MFIVISHHFCKPGQTAAAQQRVDQNGDAMTGEPGFVFRYRIERAERPEVVSTLTAWNAEADYREFRDRRAARGGGPSEESLPWDRIEGESYTVQSMHKAGKVVKDPWPHRV